MQKKFLLSVLSLVVLLTGVFAFWHPVARAQSDGTLNTLDQWKSDGTNITQRTASKPLKLTGLENKSCLGTNSSGIVGLGTCGSGGSSFAYPFPSNATSTQITFSGGIVGNLTGNASTVTNGVYTTTFPGLFDNRLSATTSLPNIATLAGLSLPYSQLTGTPTLFAYPFPANATTSALTLGGLTLSNITGSAQCLHVNSSGVVSGTGADCGSGGSSGGLATSSTSWSGSGVAYRISDAAVATAATGTVSGSNGITTTAGQSIIGSGLTITGVNAAADGSTKGVSAYTASDFDAASGVISIDYANGQAAASGVKGFLTAADWATFNGKQAAGNYITALTGDVTATGPGSVAATLATVNSNTGSFGGSTAIPNFTVNGKGLITAAGTSVVIAPAGTLSGATLNSGVTASSLTSVGTLTALTVSGQTSLQGASSTVFSSSYASSTDLRAGKFSGAGLTDCAVAGTSKLLYTAATGQFSCGTDATGTGAPYPFQGAGNSTSTLTQFNGGLTAYASTTIGNGTGIGGLTVSGNSTTTGVAYFAGTVGIGKSNPTVALDVVGAGNFSTSISVGGNSALNRSANYLNVNPTGATNSGIIFNTSVSSSAEAGRFEPNGNFGLGTTTPGTRLSVNGDAVVAGIVTGQYFVATSTLTASRFAYASTTAISGTIAQFTTASTTNLTISGISNALLKTVNGVVTAAAVGTDYYAPGSTDVAIADGGTNSSSQTTNGVNFYNGTSITSGTGLTWDGTTFQVNSAGLNNSLKIIGSNSTSAGLYFQDTNSAAQTVFYEDNDRGSFASYGGLLNGGSTNALGNLFGVSRADRVFLFADGASSNGLVVGTLTADPLILGTNNTNRMSIDSNGVLTIATTTAGTLKTTSTGVVYADTSSGGALATTTNIGDLPAWTIGKNVRVFTSTGTSTYAVPSGVTKVVVQVVGAGGGSDLVGGAAGGYCYKVVDVTGTTSIQVFVGSGGILGTGSPGPAQGGTGGWSTFGTNGFYCSASGGQGGSTGTSIASGGTGTGGDINIQGGYGDIQITTTAVKGGNGGDSPMGFGLGGAGPKSTSPNPGTGYGSGGSGINGGNSGGTNGQPGIVVVTY